MSKKKHSKLTRRDVIKSLITLPVLGYFAHRFYIKYITDLVIKIKKQPELLKTISSPVRIPSVYQSSAGDKIRIGIVGNGMRGPQIYRALGFSERDWAEPQKKSNTQRIKRFFEQDDLNVEITGVCDTYSPRAEQAAKVVTTPYRSGNVAASNPPKIYRTYREMLEDDNLDAIVILTPDHWHVEMAIDAARAGKHVYLEKPMCQTAEEAKKLRDVVKQTGITLQVGHQNRQQASYIKGKEIIEKGILGPVSMIETFTNRNSDHGAWIRGIPKEANKSNVNWKEFLGDKSWRPFNLDRYFNWQKWFEYGTGPAGNQFTHYYDCVNQVLDLGIPNKVVATGGTYYFTDPRDIPDVMNAAFEYSDKGSTLTYDCTLQNSKTRDITLLGKHAYLELSVDLAIYADRYSEKYSHLREDNEPIFTYHPRLGKVDAITSATSQYYHERGFGYTYHNGQQIDATYLHMKEWLHCIRNNKQPSCNVDRGFEETVTFYMANVAYLEERTVKWDSKKEVLV